MIKALSYTQKSYYNRIQYNKLRVLPFFCFFPLFPFLDGWFGAVSVWIEISILFCGNSKYFSIKFNKWNCLITTFDTKMLTFHISMVSKMEICFGLCKICWFSWCWFQFWISTIRKCFRISTNRSVSFLNLICFNKYLVPLLRYSNWRWFFFSRKKEKKIRLNAKNVVFHFNMHKKNESERKDFILSSLVLNATV